MMTNRQKELIKFCGYKIIDNKLVGEKECISNIFYDEKSGLFSIDISAYTFVPGDYDSIEAFTIVINRMLGLIYELNSIKDGDSSEN